MSKIDIGSWVVRLSRETIEIGEELSYYAKLEREAGKTVYPSQENIFRALRQTPPEKVKVVLVGQDPYINPGQANGTAFSVPTGCPFPPSLRNIIKELHDDIGCPIPVSGDLTPWANQGGAPAEHRFDG